MSSKTEALQSKLWGELVLPDDALYADCICTAAIPLQDKKPAICIRPRGTQDVVEAVKFASGSGLPISVKSGGHSAAAWGLVKDGLCIDLSLMRGCHVDPVKKVAIAQGGCLLGDIDRETAVYDLMVPMGHAPVTGMGLVLAGGIGIGTRLFGISSDHIISATLVKADGTVVFVDEQNDPELLWAIQGAGGALGVIVSVTLRLNQLDKENTYTGLMIWPDDAQHNNFKTIAKWMTFTAYDEPGFSCNLMRAYNPDGSAILGAMVVYIGDKPVDQKNEFMAPLRALGPVEDTVGQVRYVETQFALLGMLKGMPPHYEYWTSGQLTRAKVTDEFLDDYVATFDITTPDKFPLSMWLYDLWGGAHTKATGPTPFAQSNAEIGWMTLVGWIDPNHANAGTELSNKTKDTLNNYGISAVYQNFISNVDPSEASLASRVGGPDNLARLRDVKRRLDPANTFRSNALYALLP